MNKIESFKVDHRKIMPGIYISRVDGDVITFDMRFKKPNNGEYLSNIEMHSFEHMFATYIRNSEIADSVIYFGPMGCQTGFYLLTRDISKDKVLEVVIDTLKKINLHQGNVFGASEIECGNYKNLNLDAAKSVADEYCKALHLRSNDFIYEE